MSSSSASSLEYFTVEHFAAWCGLMIWEDGKQRPPEDWQLDFAADVFSGVKESWLIVPEGNGKTTLIAQLGLYGLEFSESPWIPVGAASRDQARIVYTQAEGFIQRTEGLKSLFRAYPGYRKVVSLRNGGVGMVVYGHDPATGDGVIPYPYAIIDELHRHADLRLMRLWKGKLRKRGGQILVISTAGEPDTPFERQREQIRRRATDRRRDGAYLRAAGPALVLHEFMVQSDAECEDMEAVKAANPLSTITAAELAEDFGSSTTDLGDWKRLKCNRPTRSIETAISDREWDDAQTDEIPKGSPVTVGVDVAWKWDTTAIVPLWRHGEELRLGRPTILVPPRDGSTLPPDEIKIAFEELAERHPIETVVMDTSRAEDIGSWLEDEAGLTVIDREQGNTHHVNDFNAFMDALRNGKLKHSGDPDLRTHVLNAVARRLPGGDYRFDRPVQGRRNPREQDRRVIDALTAAAMAVEFAGSEREPQRSVYENRGLVVA